MSAFSLRRRLAVAGAAAALVGVALPAAAATAASAQPTPGPRPGTITAVNVPAGYGWVNAAYLPSGFVYLGGSGQVYYTGTGSLVGPAGTSGCTGAIAPSLPCDSLIGRVGSSGTPFEIGDATGLVWPGDELEVAVNTPNTDPTFLSFKVTVVEVPNPQ